MWQMKWKYTVLYKQTNAPDQLCHHNKTKETCKCKLGNKLWLLLCFWCILLYLLLTKIKIKGDYSKGKGQSKTSSVFCSTWDWNNQNIKG